MTDTMQIATYKHNGVQALVIGRETMRTGTHYWLWQDGSRKRMADRYVTMRTVPVSENVRDLLHASERLHVYQQQIKALRGYYDYSTLNVISHDGEDAVAESFHYVDADDSLDVAIEMAKRWLADLREVSARVHTELNGEVELREAS